MGVMKKSEKRQQVAIHRYKYIMGTLKCIRMSLYVLSLHCVYHRRQVNEMVKFTFLRGSVK